MGTLSKDDRRFQVATWPLEAPLIHRGIWARVLPRQVRLAVAQRPRFRQPNLCKNRLTRLTRWTWAVDRRVFGQAQLATGQRDAC